MNGLKQQYQDQLQKFLETGAEEVLYHVHNLSKICCERELTPEELVAMHFEIMNVVTEGVPSTSALEAVDLSHVFLLEVMVSYSAYRGRRPDFDNENLNRWREAVFQLKSSLNYFRNRHKMILDTIPTGVVAINSKGIVTFTNREFERYFNPGSEKSLVGKNLIDTIGGGKKRNPDGSYIFKFVETLETGKILHEVEYEEPNGMIYLVSTSIVRDEMGNIKEVIASAKDITEKKRLEEILFRNEKLAAIGTMAAGIVHEVRNPMFIVRGFLQLLQAEINSTCGREYLDIALEEIDRANTVLSDFLSFAKPTSPRRSPVRLCSLINEICQLTEGGIALREINLEVVCPDNGPLVLVDKNQIKQAFLNILKNAIEALDADGKIKVAVSEDRESGSVIIMVEDNGRGMDKETVAKIFEPFFTGKETGTGLGMPISYQIIKNHGGSIEIDSIPGQGTRVTICLPVISDESATGFTATQACENAS
ncbi:MAG: ATP-binding protein [Desulfitobacteriaceae bacterium]|nr:ATP-binding protein [Desulfitobacteriaceae bacterium]